MQRYLRNCRLLLKTQQCHVCYHDGHTRLLQNNNNNCIAQFTVVVGTLLLHNNKCLLQETLEMVSPWILVAILVCGEHK